MQFTPAMLGNPDEYTIEYRVMTKNKQQEIANIAEAQGLRGMVSDLTILTDILQSKDPQGELDRIAYEQMLRQSPVLNYFDRSMRMARQADEMGGDEAKQMYLSAKLTALEGIRLMTQGNVQPQSPAEPNSNAIVPLLNNVAGGM